jgi:hypothetical protein
VLVFEDVTHRDLHSSRLFTPFPITISLRRLPRQLKYSGLLVTDLSYVEWETARRSEEEK